MTKKFETGRDNQTSINLDVLQGENYLASECHKVASTKLTGIPKKPKGIEKINVTYSVDENGLLTVTATSTNDSNIVVNLEVSQDKINLNGSEM